MKQKTKIFIIVGVGLVVAALLVYFLFFFGESKDVADADNSVGGKYTDDRFPLKRNSGGANVRALQTYLNPLLVPNGSKELTVDGKFGPKTEAAVIAYQKAKGLEVDDKEIKILFELLFG